MERSSKRQKQSTEKATAQIDEGTSEEEDSGAESVDSCNDASSSDGEASCDESTSGEEEESGESEDSCNATSSSDGEACGDDRGVGFYQQLTHRFNFASAPPSVWATGADVSRYALRIQQPRHGPESVVRVLNSSQCLLLAVNAPADTLTLRFCRVCRFCSTRNQFAGQIRWDDPSTSNHGRPTTVYGYFGDPTLMPDQCQMTAVGAVDSSGCLMLRLQPCVFAGQNLQPELPYPGDSCDLYSVDGDLSEVVSNRGGGIELYGQTLVGTEQKKVTHGLRLYLVIAADTSGSGCPWTDPAVQFATFLCGTLTRTDMAANTSAIQLLPQAALQSVHRFFKFRPDWIELERRVETANLHMYPRLFSHELRPMTQVTYDQEQRKAITAEVTPAGLVREYRHFLELKIQKQDWHSKHLSPSVIEAPNGKKLVDEVIYACVFRQPPENVI